MTAREVQRQLGVTYKAAWRMTHEIKHQLSKG
jgi:molybdenum-dependent DNA-binding transcriptional regulator ModE